MRLDVVTLFPDYLAPLHLSLVGRAIERGTVGPLPPKSSFVVLHKAPA